MRTEDPASTEAHAVKATRRDAAPGAVTARDAANANGDARRTEDRTEPDDRAPEEQGYGYGV